MQEYQESGVVSPAPPAPVVTDQREPISTVATLSSTTLMSIVAINDHHRQVRSAAKNMAEHIIKCGELLIEQKKLNRGEFCRWIEVNCEFSRATATLYMRAARDPANALAKSLRHLFPSGCQPQQKVIATETVSTTETAPPDVATVINTVNTAAGMTVEKAIRTVQRYKDNRGKLALIGYRNALSKVKALRKELDRAEILHRNAEAHLLAVAEHAGSKAAAGGAA
jgi:hypothetical protein